MKNETEFLLLSTLHTLNTENPHANQRDISCLIHLSLGLTNALLKRFAEKGWVYMKKISPKNIQYILTPEGINEFARKSVRYFENIMESVNLYKNTISDMVLQAKNNGCAQIVLMGDSELDFIIEYATHIHALAFTHNKEVSFSCASENACIFISEKIIPESDVHTEKNKESEYIYLHKLCIGDFIQ